jgi:hypothetical protein
MASSALGTNFFNVAAPNGVFSHSPDFNNFDISLNLLIGVPI